VYLPQEWLKEVGMTERDISNPIFRISVSFLVRRLLSEAEIRYRSGMEGLKYLSIRHAFAVAMAICVYRKIGRQVEERREKAWDSRTVVNKTQKILCLFGAMSMVLRTTVSRLFNPWKRVDNLEIWRHQWSPVEPS
jgi:phytoene synthase